MIYEASLVCFLSWAFPLCADCVHPVSQAIVDGFLKEPHSLLVSYPQGDEAFIRTASAYASVNADALKAVAAIVPDANIEQRQAIGVALGRVAAACASQHPEISRRIAVAIRSISDDEVLRSYDRVTGAPAAPLIDAKPPAAPPSAPPLGRDLSSLVSRKALKVQDPLQPVRPIDEFR